MIGEEKKKFIVTRETILIEKYEVEMESCCIMSEVITDFQEYWDFEKFCVSTTEKINYSVEVSK